MLGDWVKESDTVADKEGDCEALKHAVPLVLGVGEPEAESHSEGDGDAHAEGE